MEKILKYRIRRAERLIRLAQSESEVSHGWGYNIGGEKRASKSIFKEKKVVKNGKRV